MFDWNNDEHDRMADTTTTLPIPRQRFSSRRTYRALTFSLRVSGDRWVSRPRADAAMLTFILKGSNRGRLQTLQALNIVS